MTKYQLLDENKRREFMTIINHSLLYDDSTFKKIYEIVEKSNPVKEIILFPNDMPNEN